MDGGAWKAAVHGVAEGRTRLRNFTFTFHFHALEKEMAPHSSVLAWRIPGTGKPVFTGKPTLSPGFHISLNGATIFPVTQVLGREGNGTPLQYSCLENPMDGGAWWAAVHGVTKSQT